MGARSAYRRAVKLFAFLMKEQAPFKTPYSGFAAYSVQRGIPQHVAVDLVYKHVSDREITVHELRALIDEEAEKWC